jgi:manganese transport protein
MITRGLAIVPAVLLVSGAGQHKTVDLLVLTQIVLSMQLPFAIFPLVMFTSSRRRMGGFASPRWLVGVGYTICVVITGLNVKLLGDLFGWPRVGAGLAVMALFAAYVQFVYRPPAPTPALVSLGGE